jgi:hypothetical protein
MPNKPRNSDGTMRRANNPKRLTNRSIIARWVEAETLHLKRLGMGYQAIADHIVEVAQGRQKAMAPVPQGAQFPEGYQISLQAIHRAFRRAIVRLPNAEAAELRKLDSERPRGDVPVAAGRDSKGRSAQHRGGRQGAGA